MKIVIQDASVLIDMDACGLLDAWFGLGLDLRTTSLILREITRKSQSVKLKHFADAGQLAVEKVPGETIAQLAMLRASMSSRLTIEDVSALYYAEKEGGILLTGDRRLREHAEAQGVETHGLLWVFDILVSRGALLPGLAAERLQTLMECGTCRLPKQECETRIKRWNR